MASPGPKSDKIWADAIRRAVSRCHEEKDAKGKVQKLRYLNLLADNLVKSGLKGDVAALKEIGDRLDGKATQGVNVSGKLTVEKIEREIVDPSNPDG